tara:strand:- start:5317 stop:5676 length:360 start_codon:yes stop_codon:yes gene_type:complete
MATQSEGDISRAIRHAVEDMPEVERLFRVQSGMLRVKGGFLHCAPTGTSDLFGFCRHGIAIGIEVKKPGEKPTPSQVSFLTALAESGGVAIVAHSVDEARSAIVLACRRHDIADGVTAS